jgi:hypothetical protein
MSTSARPHQGGLVFLVMSVDLGVLLDQKLAYVPVSVTGGLHQDSLPLRVDMVGDAPLPHEELDALISPGEASPKEAVPAFVVLGRIIIIMYQCLMEHFGNYSGSSSLRHPGENHNHNVLFNGICTPLQSYYDFKHDIMILIIQSNTTILSRFFPPEHR